MHFLFSKADQKYQTFLPFLKRDYASPPFLKGDYVILHRFHILADAYGE